MTDRQIDARVKLVWLGVVTLSAAQAGVQGLVVLCLALAGALLWCNIRILLLGRLLWPLLPLLAGVVVVRGMSASGTPLMGFGGVALTREGLADGVLIGWRLAVIAAAGIAFAAATPPTQIKAALHWMLRPFLKARAGRVATLLALVLRFIAAIGFHARAVSEAQQARCIDRRRDPFYRIRVFALPLLVKSLVSADRLALAMAARCYTDERTDPAFAFRTRDAWALVAVSAMAVAVVAL